MVDRRRLWFPQAVASGLLLVLLASSALAYLPPWERVIEGKMDGIQASP